MSRTAFTILTAAAFATVAIAQPPEAVVPGRPASKLTVDPIKVTLKVSYVHRWSRIIRLTLDPAIPLNCAPNPQIGKLTSCTAAVPIGRSVTLTASDEPGGGAAGWVYKPPMPVIFPKECAVSPDKRSCQITLDGPRELTLSFIE